MKEVTQQEKDSFWMQQALDLARRGEGYVSPNPMVGCVIVSQEGERIGAGYHEKYGEAHAEVNAVNSVRNKKDFEGATVYVSLEPCAHYGKTPPCSSMLAKLPISRVVVAHPDPNSKVNGAGLSEIRNAGIQVHVGIMQKEAEDLNEFFIHHQTYGRPFITLKIAQTADGYTAAPDGDSKWISGKDSRKLVHEWRAKYDAVLVGRSTAIADNPSLTVRHVSGRQPKRIVIDGPYELPKELNLFSDKLEEKTIIITWNKKASETDADPMLKLMKHNYFRGEVIHVSKKDGHANLQQAFKELGERGITSVLVEGGQQLSSALLKEGLVDKLELFISPKLLGGGTRSVLNLGINKMRDITELKEVTWTKIGDDMLLTGYL
jgi:diaminohydroxyphosphoribosylaminopyrimidine deaminase/5-amino-6-(5-phosphoribosylamino)uracil reductase